MQQRTNRRGYTENFVMQRHLNLTDLKEECINSNTHNGYLGNKVPNYPKPEFHVSRLKHETSGSGLRGIRKDGGFRSHPAAQGGDPSEEEGDLIWWSLAVGPEEINDAEKRIVKEKFEKDRIEKERIEKERIVKERLVEKSFSERGMVAPEQNFLWKFATSPAFMETSRLGSFRFTFPLEEVLKAYKEQICSGVDPVMRVYKTILYKQEVVYAVLVHRPQLNGKFSEYPLLKDNPNAICVYKDGRFIWKSEAMCGTHWYEFDEEQMEPKDAESHQYYVWDHVALALHVEKDQVLKLDLNKPEDFLTYCEKDDVIYRGEFQNPDEANKLVEELWPEWQGPLKVERPLQIHYPVTELKLVLTGSSGEETTATGNALCGRKAFHSSGLRSVEMKVDNLEVKIINTPKFSEFTSVEATLKYIRRSGPALHVFLLVISLKDISANQITTTIQNFESRFQNKALRRTLILFTHQDQTEPDIQEMMQEVQQFLTEKVSNRFLVFNNKLEDRDPEKLSALLTEVKKILGIQF